MTALPYKKDPMECFKEKAFIRSYQSPYDKRPKLSDKRKESKPHA